ncbi:Titin [Geodia barretti]|uniref:Titin n=1 Tax=Geodia barretti TaxID=519541 RepID=A0AA35RXL1_GEOBA|nr:Titin [Geodia barretti]
MLFAAVAPEITADEEGLVKFPLNGTLHLSCSFQSVPAPDSAKWTHNGTQLLSTLVTLTASTTTLTRTNLQANGGGAYACSASNEVGSDTATTFVRIQLPSDPVSDLEVIERATDSLTLSWTNPHFTGFASITSFRVIITGGGPEGSEAFGGDETLTEYTVSSLSPLSFYTISLSAVNDAGLQSLPVIVQESTRSLRLPVIEEPVIIVVNSTAILLQWQSPRYDPATTYPVTSYQLTYIKQGGRETPTNRSLPLQPTSVTVGNLAKGTVYVFTLAPVNTAGPGATFTYEPTETFIDPPSPPREVTAESPNPFTIQLSWSPPSSDGGRPIGEYRIQVFTSGEYSSTYNLPGSAETYDITELSQNTSYEIRITAVNADNQESNYVAVMQTTAPVGDPQPPVLDAFSAARVGNTMAEISWDTPGGFPNRYIIQIRASSQNKWNMTINFTISVQLLPSRQTFVFKDLQPLTAYSVRIQSENVKGLSEFTEIFTFKTYGDVEISGDEAVSVGSTLSLGCGLEGADSSDSNINYTWSSTNGPLPPRASVGEVDGVLVIQDVRREDGGVYTCTANGVSGNITVEVSRSSNLSLVGIVAGSAGGGILITLIVCTVLCIVWCYRRSNSKVVVDDIDSPPVMDRCSHIYECLPLSNAGPVYNNPITFMPNKAYGVGLNKNLKEVELAKSCDDVYVEVQAGVRRQPEMIYDLAVHNPMQTKAEESEEDYDEAYDPESDLEEACTNM